MVYTIIAITMMVSHECILGMTSCSLKMVGCDMCEGCYDAYTHLASEIAVHWHASSVAVRWPAWPFSSPSSPHA